MQRRQVSATALAAGGLLVISIGLSLSYWPGVMTWDSIRQYGQALSGRFDDWHPPLMEWFWRELLPVAHGPAPMLLLQLVVYAAGWGLLVGWALEGRRPVLAMALAAASLTPLAVALMATIVKDCLMAALLLAATGVLAWRREGRDWPPRLLAVALVVVACALRFNAFLAGAPLLVALLPEALRRTPFRLAATGLAAMAALLAATPVANHLLRASRSGVELSLVNYDLGGITEYGGKSVFPALPDVDDPMAANHRCYTPVQWDLYADWAEEDCPVGFDVLRPAFKAQGINPTLFWIKAIAAHPLAYAEHRLGHFNINARFLVAADFDRRTPADVYRPVHDRSVDNPWRYQVTPNPAVAAVDAMALVMARTPLGWPIVWMALAGGMLTLAVRLPSRHLIVPLALSSLLYGLGYGVVSVSSELRYHLWTMLAALVAACVTVADLSAVGARFSRRDYVMAALPPVLIALIGAAWRLWPG
ncbi:MAG TPA: hypothetical protein VGM25_17870 [Caulobacteraceae bacterium]|jgi:hypothetical protein